MKKLMIVVGVLVAVLVVLVVGAALIVPRFISTDWVVAKVQESVKNATGRDLKIAGPVRISVLPRLEVEADNVSFANAAGASSPEMAKIARLQVALGIIPLMSGELAIDRFVLVEPQIHLEVDRQGRPNWVFATPGQPAAPGRPAPAAPANAPSAGGGKMPLSQLRLGDIQLANGHIDYLDQRTGERQTVDAISMKIALPSLDSAFSAEGAATWKGKKVSLTVHAASPRALMEGKSSKLDLKVASETVNFDFKGEGGGTPFQLSGDVGLAVPSIRNLAAWAAQPIQAPGQGLGPLDIKGHIAFGSGKVSFSNAQLSVDAIKGKGDFALDTSGARPSLKGRLDLDQLDVNPYLPPEESKPAAQARTQNNAAGSGGGAEQGWSDAPIDFSGLKAADVDFALTMASLKVRKIQVGKSALGLQLKDGRLTADLGELTLYGGKGQGKVTLDGNGVPATTATFKLTGIQAEPLLKDAMDFDRVSGSGNLDLDVTARGKSQRELISALAGKGDVRLLNGTIRGINLASILRNPAALVGAGSQTSEQTDFSELTGTYTITAGIVKNSDLALKSPVVQATGDGTVDLPRQRVDYKVHGQLVGVSVPVGVLVSGPWNNLSYRPDLSDIVKSPGKILEGVGGGVQGGAQGGSNLLKGLLGK